MFYKISIFLDTLKCETEIITILASAIIQQ